MHGEGLHVHPHPAIQRERRQQSMELRRIRNLVERHVGEAPWDPPDPDERSALDELAAAVSFGFEELVSLLVGQIVRQVHVDADEEFQGRRTLLHVESRVRVAAGGRAAVDDERAPVHVGARVRQEEADGLGDLLGLPHSLHRGDHALLS